MHPFKNLYVCTKTIFIIQCSIVYYNSTLIIASFMAIGLLWRKFELKQLDKQICFLYANIFKKTFAKLRFSKFTVAKASEEIRCYYALQNC